MVCQCLHLGVSWPFWSETANLIFVWYCPRLVMGWRVLAVGWVTEIIWLKTIWLFWSKTVLTTFSFQGASKLDSVPDCYWNSTAIRLIPLSSFLGGCCRRWACAWLSVGCWVPGVAWYERVNLNQCRRQPSGSRGWVLVLMATYWDWRRAVGLITPMGLCILQTVLGSDWYLCHGGCCHRSGLCMAVSRL